VRPNLRPTTADRLWSYRRILELEKLTHDCSIGRQSFQQPQQAASVEGQGDSALRFGEPRVQALFAVVVIFSLQHQGFRDRELRRLLAQALGSDNQQITQGKISYDLPTAASTRTN
jgi:hypothetical protein